MGQASTQVVRINKDVHAIATELHDEVARQSDPDGIHAGPGCDRAVDDRKQDWKSTATVEDVVHEAASRLLIFIPN